MHRLIQLCGGYCCSNLFLITLKNNSPFLPTRCTEEVTRQLMQTAAHPSERDGILATRLCTHKDDVEITNERRLHQLPGELCGETAGFGAELCVDAMGVLACQVELVFCHAQQHQSKLCVLELSWLGEKLHSFLFKNPQCHYLVCSR